MNFGSHLIDALCNAFVAACALIVFVVFAILGALLLSEISGTYVSPYFVAFLSTAGILIVAYIYWHRQRQKRKREAEYFEQQREKYLNAGSREGIYEPKRFY